MEALIKKHEDFEKSLSDLGKELRSLGQQITGDEEEEIISRRTKLLQRCSLLQEKSDARKTMLEDSHKFQQFQRDSQDLGLWIQAKETHICSIVPDSDVELLSVKLNSFWNWSFLEMQEFRVKDVCEKADKLVSNQHPESVVVTNKKTELSEAWARLKSLVNERQQKLFGAHEIQRFNRDADETIAWIAEKVSALSADDFGKDLTSVKTLQRKHEGVERDLPALEHRVSTINKEADRLRNRSEQINMKKEEINWRWAELVSAAKERKKKLDESYYLRRFLADFQDLTLWINNMKAVISADERHKSEEHKSEIDAREDSFTAIAEAGKRLLGSDHYASDEVKEKLAALSEAKNALLELWKERRILYEQCMDRQLFYRDTEQADTWMAKQEDFLMNQV